MYTAKVRLGRPQELLPLDRVPDLVIQIEDIRSLPDEPWSFIFWASGDDFATYEAELDADPNIATYTCLTTLPDRRLYRVSLTDAGQSKTIHPVVVEEDILILDLTFEADCIEFIGRFPSREAMAAFRDAAREQHGAFQLVKLYEDLHLDADDGERTQYGVTNPQREALLTALEHGYFEIPRQTTMEEIAVELDISTAALSTRLRRGQQALLRNTLAEYQPI